MFPSALVGDVLERLFGPAAEALARLSHVAVGTSGSAGKSRLEQNVFSPFRLDA
jgi:hypothetical protein